MLFNFNILSDTLNEAPLQNMNHNHTYPQVCAHCQNKIDNDDDDDNDNNIIIIIIIIIILIVKR